MCFHGMERKMKNIFNILASAAGIYSILIFIRIIITWFSQGVPSKPVEFLSRLTDPYLNWWRKILKLRIGVLDLSPLAGIAALSILQRMLYYLAGEGRVSLGIFLAMILVSAWSIIGFILGFCTLLLVIRFIGYITNRNMYSHFWRLIDTITQPILYRLNRIIFGNRIPEFKKGILLSALLLGVVWIGGGFIIPYIARFLSKLPV